MKLAIIVPAAMAILAAAGVHAQTVSADKGHRLVQRDCAMCHAVEGTGGGSPIPGAPPFRDLHLIFPLNQLAKALTEGTIASHPPPPYRLSASDIADIVRYVNGIQTD